LNVLHPFPTRRSSDLEKQADLQTYLSANTPKATLADQVNYWGNYPKFFVSLMKSFYGDAAQKENDWGFEWLPKWDQAYDVIKYRSEEHTSELQSRENL